jgi:hypothetical protein
MVNLPAQQLSSSEPWEELFNGKDFENWKVVNNENNVRIEDSAFVCHPVANTAESTFLCTKEIYGDFIFEAEAIIEGPLHTNFIIRGIEKNNDDSKVYLSGYQVKIDPTDRRWTGGIFDGVDGEIIWYYPLDESEEARSAFKFKEWNSYRIEAIGDSIKVWVNGIPTSNLVHNRYTKGFIGIKVHSIGNFPELEKVFMKFKNLRIITKEPEKYKRSASFPVKDLRDS